MGRVLIGVGSNSGHRSRLIKKALNLLQREMRIERVSSFVRSAPAEGVSGGYFLNGVVQAKTSLQPASVVKFLQSVEVSLGRPANHPRKQARCIDLDLLFYDGYTIRSKNLVIPHPAALKRWFVVLPLLEIAPRWRDPISGKRLQELAGKNRYCGKEAKAYN